MGHTFRLCCCYFSFLFLFLLYGWFIGVLFIAFRVFLFRRRCLPIYALRYLSVIIWGENTIVMLALFRFRWHDSDFSIWCGFAVAITFLLFISIYDLNLYGIFFDAGIEMFLCRMTCDGSITGWTGD
jgi:hypothetical protein